MVLLHPEESVYLSDTTALEMRAAGAPEAWTTLLKLSGALRPTRGPAAVARGLLQLLFEALPAEASAVLFDDSPECYTCHRSLSGRPDIEVSAPVVDRIRQAGVSALVQREGRSICAAPLVSCERAVAVLYLHSAERGQGFDADHLKSPPPLLLSLAL